MKRLFAAVAVAVGLVASAFAETIDLSTVTADTTLNDKDVITGTLGASVKLSIADGAYVTLQNATINGANSSSCKWAGLTCEGNAEIRIDGENYVKGFHEDYPSIHVPEGKTLTIRQAVNISGYAALGGGTLTVPGHNYAAGIGAGNGIPCGNIVIESGIIFATGKVAAGIGGASGASCGNITIRSGVVYATGGWTGAGIGGGTSGCGAITIEDGVTLVVAQCGDHNNPNPIGAGGGGTCGAVTVTLAEGATDTTGVTGLGYPTRTIEGRVGAQQYANGLTWDFRIIDGTAEICDMYYTSDGEAHYRAAIDSGYTGALVIPDTLGGKPVTRIGNYAFAFCKKITSVTIPATVTSIGEGAFQLCEALTDATLPVGVTAIEARAFESCFKLATAAIPSTVTSIGTMAFSDCDGLTSVTIPGGVKLIGHSAFSGCDGLTSVTIMDGVETIGRSAFRDCGSLTSITIPASVKTIEGSAFWECTSLATVSFPEGTVIEDGVFFGCSALADANGFLIINGVLHQYMGGDADVTVPAGVTRIGVMAFAAHTSNPLFGMYPPLVSVTIPDSVTSIGMMSFAYCTDLERVNFPANMPSVEDGAFLLCVKLADADGFVIIGGALHMYIGTASAVTIPDGVTSIGPQSFLTYTEVPPYYQPSPVTSLTIPSGVTNIFPQAFGYCPVLTTVSIPSTVTSIGEGAFYETLGGTVPLQTVHVEAGDTERVKGLLVASEHPVDGITFVEDYLLPRTVTFNANGGSGGTERIVIDGSEIGDLPVPTRDGYTFKGWFTAASGGMEVTATTVVTGDITYYAQWTVVKRTVTFNANGGSGGTTRTVDNGAAVGALPSAMRDGWEFKGWFTAASGGTQITAATVVTADVTYYAQWAQNGGGSGGGSGGEGGGGSGGEGGGGSGGGVTPDPETPCYEMVEASDIESPYSVLSAQTIHGAVYRSCDVVGIVELKLGKVNQKKKSGKISGTLTDIYGKKHKIASKKLANIDDKAPLKVQLDVKDYGTMDLTIGYREFAGSIGKLHVQSANVNRFGKAAATVEVAAGDLSKFTGKVVEELLPTDGVKGSGAGKWSFDKGPSVKWAKVKAGTALRYPQYADSGKGLVVGEGSNPSCMKLTFTAKKGTFKGSFKVYALEGTGTKTKLKKYTMKVNGVVVDGVGYGVATCRNPSVTWEVRVK